MPISVVQTPDTSASEGDGITASKKQKKKKRKKKTSFEALGSHH